MERRVNGAGRFVLCSIVDLEAKRFCLVFIEGMGLLGGSAILAEKLQALGVVTQAKAKTKAAASRTDSKMKAVTKEGKAEKSLGKLVEGEKKAFVGVAREPAGRIGDALWLQFGGRELRGRKDVLGRCLVGRWGNGSVVELEIASFRKWGKRFWNLKKDVKVMKLGGAFFLLEFEDEEKAKRVLKRGMHCYKDKFLHLDKWSEEAGCLHLGSLAKEVWVRVMGLPLHCWSGEVFKKIGDCCGGFVEVNEETKRFSQLQWARILVKAEGIDFPRTLHLVVKSYCYAVQRWWEVSSWVSAVVPMNKLKGREGEKVREEKEVGSCAESNSGMGKDIWCAAEVDGAGSVRTNRSEEKGDGNGTAKIVDGFSSFGKGIGEKGDGRVGLRENGGVNCI